MCCIIAVQKQELSTLSIDTLQEASKMPGPQESFLWEKVLLIQNALLGGLFNFSKYILISISQKVHHSSFGQERGPVLRYQP